MRQKQLVVLAGLLASCGMFSKKKSPPPVANLAGVHAALVDVTINSKILRDGTFALTFRWPPTENVTYCTLEEFDGHNYNILANIPMNQSSTFSWTKKIAPKDVGKVNAVRTYQVCSHLSFNDDTESRECTEVKACLAPYVLGKKGSCEIHLDLSGFSLASKGANQILAHWEPIEGINYYLKWSNSQDSTISQSPIQAIDQYLISFPGNQTAFTAVVQVCASLSAYSAADQCSNPQSIEVNP